MRARPGRAGAAALLAAALLLAAVALASADSGKRGPRGPQGPRGATGAQGPQGPSGSIPLTYVRNTFTADHLARFTGQSHCPAGQVTTGGGVLGSGPYDTQWINGTSIGPGGWIGDVDQISGSNDFTVTAICTPGTISQAAKAGHGKRGRRGPPGPRGATGPQGPAGPDGLVVRFVSTDLDSAPRTQTVGTADCPPGEHPISGGVSSGGGVATQELNTSSPPLSSEGSWVGAVDNFTDHSIPFTVVAICANATTSTGTGKRTGVSRAGLAKHRHRGRRGPAGPRGPQGATGPQGPAGTAPASLEIQRVFQTFSVDQQRGEVACPPGETVIGGGVRIASGSYRQAEVTTSIPTDRSWIGYVDDLSGGGTGTFQVVALCVQATEIDGKG